MGVFSLPLPVPIKTIIDQSLCSVFQRDAFLIKQTC